MEGSAPGGRDLTLPRDPGRTQTVSSVDLTVLHSMREFRIYPCSLLSRKSSHCSCLLWCCTAFLVKTTWPQVGQEAEPDNRPLTKPRILNLGSILEPSVPHHGFPCGSQPSLGAWNAHSASLWPSTLTPPLASDFALNRSKTKPALFLHTHLQQTPPILSLLVNVTLGSAAFLCRGPAAW